MLFTRTTTTTYYEFDAPLVAYAKAYTCRNKKKILPKIIGQAWFDLLNDLDIVQRITNQPLQRLRCRSYGYVVHKICECWHGRWPWRNYIHRIMWSTKNNYGTP